MSDPFDIYDKYKHQLDLVIDGGVLKSERSTVLDLSEGNPQIVREGKGDISGIF